MIKPISPNEIASQKVKNLPDEVIECWNSIIARKFAYGTSIILLKDVISELCVIMNKTHKQIYELGYLDIEEVYRNVGWDVKYDKPGYNETYDANYIFKKTENEA